MALCSMGLWYLKIEPSQNKDLSTSFERPYKELLNAIISFEIRHSELKLWTIKTRASKWQKNPFAARAIAFGTSKLNPLRIKI